MNKPMTDAILRIADSLELIAKLLDPRAQKVIQEQIAREKKSQLYDVIKQSALKTMLPFVTNSKEKLAIKICCRWIAMEGVHIDDLATYNFAEFPARKKKTLEHIRLVQSRMRTAAEQHTKKEHR